MVGGFKKIDGIQPKKTENPKANLEKESILKDNLIGRPILSWRAPSFVCRDKSAWWFLAVSLIVLGLVVYFIFQNDWFSIAIVVIVTLMLFWYAIKEKPVETEYSISNLGIMAGRHFYPFSEIHSFWIIYNEKVQSLNIAFAKKYLPTLSINIQKINPIDLRAMLAAHIPEQEKKEEPFVDRLLRLLGI